MACTATTSGGRSPAVIVDKNAAQSPERLIEPVSRKAGGHGESEGSAIGSFRAFPGTPRTYISSDFNTRGPSEDRPNHAVATGSGLEHGPYPDGFGTGGSGLVSPTVPEPSRRGGFEYRLRDVRRGQEDPRRRDPEVPERLLAGSSKSESTHVLAATKTLSRRRRASEFPHGQQSLIGSTEPGLGRRARKGLDLHEDRRIGLSTERIVHLHQLSRRDHPELTVFCAGFDAPNLQTQDERPSD